MKKPRYAYSTSYCQHPDGSVTKWSELKFLKEEDGSLTLIEAKTFVSEEEKNASLDRMMARCAKHIAEMECLHGK